MIKKLVLVSSQFCLLFLMAFACTLNGCNLEKLVKGICYMKKEKITTKKGTYKDQTVIFVPIQHFGQKIFYQSLTDSIKHWKEDGFRIYYEQLTHKGMDSTAIYLAENKWRKINRGSTGSRESYAELQIVFKNSMVQPTWKDLGITNSDLNADANLNDLITQYEVLYGTIELTDCDKNTPFRSPEYDCSEKLNNDLEPIIIDYRNQNVASFVKNNHNDKKIAIIYGANHIKGIMELLETQTD